MAFDAQHSTQGYIQKDEHETLDCIKSSLKQKTFDNAQKATHVQRLIKNIIYVQSLFQNQNHYPSHLVPLSRSLEMNSGEIIKEASPSQNWHKVLAPRKLSGLTQRLHAEDMKPPHYKDAS